MKISIGLPILLALSLVGICSIEARAAFSQNSRRYLSSKDMFSVLKQKFPVLESTDKLSTLPSSCWIAEKQNLSVLGAVVPFTGKPASDLPSPGFVRWLGSCVVRIVSLQVSDLARQPTNQALWEQYFPSLILAKYSEQVKTQNSYDQVLAVLWSDLTPQLQEALITHAIEGLIGPASVVRDLGFVKSSSELNQVVRRAVSGDDKLNLERSVILIYSAIVMREEFLTY